VMGGVNLDDQITDPVLGVKPGRLNELKTEQRQSDNDDVH
jgi:hypothetical protein